MEKKLKALSFLRILVLTFRSLIGRVGKILLFVDNKVQRLYQRILSVVNIDTEKTLRGGQIFCKKF